MDGGARMEWRGPRFWEAGVKCGAWNGGFPKASQWGMPMFMRPLGWSLKMSYHRKTAAKRNLGNTAQKVTLAKDESRCEIFRILRLPVWT